MIGALLRDLGARRVGRRALHALEARVAIPARPPSPISHPDLGAWLAAPPLPRFHALGRLVSTGAWAAWMRAHLTGAQRDAVLARAHDAARARVFAYGHLPLDFGQPTDWHRSPADGAPWPRALPHQRVLRAAPPGADVKDTWALGRAGHLMHLCRGHALAPDDPTWRDAFDAHVTGFTRDNPFGLGTHWASGQEVAIRALLWLTAAGVLGPPRPFDLFMRALRRHGAHLDANLGFARWAVPNNHLIAEASALAILGHVLPHAPEAARWRRRGRAALLEALDLQFLPDGGYCQSSHTYHRHALTLLLFARQWLGPVDPELRERVDATFARSGAHLASFLLGDGLVPNHGHNDGAWIVPWAATGVRDFRPILQTARLVTARARAFLAGPWDESALFWLGLRALDAPRAPWPTRDRFPHAGWSILRAHGGDAVLRDGPPIQGFGQSDTLHVTFSRHGRPWLLDAGSGRYNGDPGRLARHAHQAAHDAPTDRGADYSRRVGTFTWIEAPEVTRHHTAGCLRASTPASPHLHVTRTVAPTPDGWRVVDDLTVTDDLEVWLRWLVPHADWVFADDGAAFTATVRGESVRVEVTVEGARLRMKEPERGDYAPRYADAAPATALGVVAFVGAAGGRVVTRFRFGGGRA